MATCTVRVYTILVLYNWYKLGTGLALNRITLLKVVAGRGVGFVGVVEPGLVLILAVRVCARVGISINLWVSDVFRACVGR